MRFSLPKPRLLCVVWNVIALAALLGAAERRQDDPDREALLSLSWQEFDQKQNSGWRVFVNPDRKEYLVGARLIEAYLERHRDLTARQRALLHYHAVHLYIYRAVRGGEGDVKEALPHLEGAVVAHGEEPPSADWNDLVQATKAFLLGDRNELLAVRARLASLPPASIKFMQPPHSADDLLAHLGKPYGSWFDRSDTKNPPNRSTPPTAPSRRG
jgi:hypothetical protein